MKIDIVRNSVMSIVEGISVTISQKEDTGVSFEQLWASEDERLKLDIYYREAISDLEKNITKWLGASTNQFSLEYKDEGDYTLRLSMRYWPMKRKGLLGNKLQDYMVHAILAGWLNNFVGLEIKADYAAMAASDLTDIRDIICKKSFDFESTERTDDDQVTDSDNMGAVTRQRKADDVYKNMYTGNTSVSCRKMDFAHQTLTHERTDWSDISREEMMMLRPERPHTIITREPIIPSGKPTCTLPKLCKHRVTPFEMPPENPNESDT